MKTFIQSFNSIFLLFFFCSFYAIAQQNITLPQSSQHASVTQDISVVKITIDYHRPAVKERRIWGALVPYGEIWRAGANQNTTISFSHPVLIDRKEVPAGTYGLHMIPTENDWTIILNKDSRAWGSFFYKEENDQLRFNVKPESSPHQEWLLYSFDMVLPNSATVSLRWEKLRVPFKIEIDRNKIMLEDIEQQLTGIPGFFWQGWNTAANYCYANGIRLEKGLEWADHSIGINKNVANTFTKALILNSLGRKDEAARIKSEAFTNATEADVNNLGYQLLGGGKTDDAIEVFKKNTELYPDSWNVWDSLGEGFMNKGETKLAVDNYNKALGMSPENQHSRIKGVLKQLGVY